MRESGGKRPVVDESHCEALCTCGNRHAVPDVGVLTADHAYQVLSADCAREHAGGSVLLLDDENTHLAAGARLAGLLEEQPVTFKRMRLPDDPAATEELAEEVYRASEGHGLILAVGAGTVNDLGKYVSDRRGIPYWAVPTAPSMNGYTSSIVAIRVRGVKRTLPSRPPRYIYADPGVIRASPLELRQAGFCDVLAKWVSDFDWRTESLLFGGSYCGLPSAIVHEPEKRYIDRPEGILEGDRESVLGLFEGLLYSGIAMSLAGSSAPASGGEHLISHFLDMRENITGIEPNLHGIQVGLGTVLSAVCYRRLAALDAGDLRERAAETFEADAARITAIWDGFAPEVKKQFQGKRDRLMQFDTLLPENWSELAALFGQVREPEFFVDLFRRTGLPMTLASLGVARDEFTLAATSARTIRDRITVLDLAAHAGVLEDAAEEAVQMLS